MVKDERPKNRAKEIEEERKDIQRETAEVEWERSGEREKVTGIGHMKKSSSGNERRVG